MKRYKPKMFIENPVTKEISLFDDYKARNPFLGVKHLQVTMTEDPNGEWVKWKDVPAWISVNDRLPDKNALYLIYAPSLDKNSPLIQCAWYDPNGFGWSGLVEIWLKAITHWMPLPESLIL